MNGSPLGGFPLNAPKRVKRNRNSQKGAFPLKQLLLEKSPRLYIELQKVEETI